MGKADRGEAPVQWCLLTTGAREDAVQSLGGGSKGVVKMAPDTPFRWRIYTPGSVRTAKLGDS